MTHQRRADDGVAFGRPRTFTGKYADDKAKKETTTMADEGIIKMSAEARELVRLAGISDATLERSQRNLATARARRLGVPEREPVALSGGAGGDTVEPIKMTARAAEICASLGISKETQDRAMANLAIERARRLKGLG